MNKLCKNCGVKFILSEKEKTFYAKLDVPSPTLCSDCRMQRRYAFRNERVMYKRKCDGTGQDVISIYSPDKPFKAYTSDYWWSDKWDPMEFGRDFDFSRPFFEQFYEFQKQVPRLYAMVINSVNCTYTNMAGDNKNCYLLFASENDEDCYYSKLAQHCRDCIDCSYIYDSELLYECVNCLNCYHCLFSMDLANSHDCYFCADLKGCRECVFSWGLRDKQYYIFNQQKTKEEYDAEIKKIFSSPQSIEKAKKDYGEMLKNRIVKYAEFLKCEECTGDYLKTCKRVTESFDVMNGWDCAHLTDACDPKDTHDSSFIYYKPELCYETMATLQLYNVQFATCCFYCANIQYCDHCYHSKNCFGCVGLKRGEYCIFNKEYSQKDYEDLRKRIIEHMKRTGEWGEFFPIALSPFCYNETVAVDYYPMTAAQAAEKGYAWKDAEPAPAEGKKVPEIIATSAPDNIVNEIFSCESCGRKIKFIPQEIKFYKHQNLPLPRICFECRYQTRHGLRTERKLYKRACSKCGAAIITAYNPNRFEKVYCEKCYLKTVG